MLVNVAGIGFGRRIGDVTPDEWRRIIDVNLTGTFLLSQAALAPLLETRGTIVNMASVAGLRATPYNAAYCASKGGVIMLTKSMALELAARRGAGQCGLPGLGRHAVSAQLPHSPRTPTWRCWPGRSSPMGSIIDVAEVAAAVAYLASDDAATRERDHARHRWRRDRLTSLQGHRLGVMARAQHPAGPLGPSPARRLRLRAADKDVVDSHATRPRAARRRREGREATRAASLPTVSGSKTTRSANHPSAIAAPVRQAVVASGPIGHHLDRFLEREQPSLADHLAQHDGRVVGVAHEVDVGAGIGPAEHDPGVLPHCRPGPATPRRSDPATGSAMAGPRYNVRSSTRTTSIRTSMTSVPRAAAISPRDRPTHCDAGVADLHEGKVAEHPKRPRWPTFCAPARRRALVVGIGHRATTPGGVAGATTSPHPGRLGSKVDARMRMRSGQGKGNHVRTSARRHVRRPELLLVDLLRRQAAEEIPVQRTIRRQ